MDGFIASSSGLAATLGRAAGDGEAAHELPAAAAGATGVNDGQRPIQRWFTAPFDDQAQIDGRVS